MCEAGVVIGPRFYTLNLKNINMSVLKNIKKLYQQRMIRDFEPEEFNSGRNRPKVRTRAALSNALLGKATYDEVALLWGIHPSAVRRYNREHEGWMNQDIDYPAKYKIAVDVVTELTRPLNAIALKPIYGETPEEMALIIDHTMEVLAVLKNKLNEYS